MILFSFSFVVAVVGTWRFKTKTKDEFFLNRNESIYLLNQDHKLNGNKTHTKEEPSYSVALFFTFKIPPQLF